MDFLDPRKRRANRNRLIVGYFLVAIAIGLATVILVYGAYGYGINTKTGEIVENGLLFTDSKPGGAKIFLNGKDQNKQTRSRIVLPSGNYTLTLKKDGYRDWQRKFTLEEHSVARYVYPFLFPTNPKSTALKVFDTAPALITESPSRRWLIVNSAISETKGVSFDEYDTSNVTKPSRHFVVPRSVFNSNNKLAKLSVIEWSTDNNFFLVENQLSKGSEFVVIDRRTPQNSFNINKLFKINPSAVSLRDKKINQLYLFDNKARTLRVGVTNNGTLRPVFLKNVIAFKSYGASLISYVTDQSSTSGKVESRIWDNGETFPLYTFPAGKYYLLDAAQYQGSWYYVAGSNTTDRINIFKDPLNTIKNPDFAQAIPVSSLRVLGATNVKFSNNTRFISVQAGQHFGVYDLEQSERFQYINPFNVNTPMDWMDGHRLIGAVKGTIAIFDFDATNNQLLLPTTMTAGGYFSGDYNRLYTLAPIKNSKGNVLEIIDMRAGSDLPTTP